MRLGAILIGLLPFLLFELVLTLIGWQAPGGVADPYVGFTAVRPLFELDESGTRYAISQHRMPLFCPDDFSAEKPKDEYRVFCLGGSTVQGRPFAIETSFSKWLELRLQAADPSKKWNVINCGGVSYASYRLAPIMDEILKYKPDLIVLYTGHNEFLEDRTYESIKLTAPWVMRTHERLSAVRTYSFLRQLVVGSGVDEQAAERLPLDVEARLDFREGLTKYHRDDEWKRNVVQHFEHNLRRMAQAAGDANVPLMLCNPTANLVDAAPFKSQHDSGLSDSEVAEFSEAWQQLNEDELGILLNQTDDELKDLVELCRLSPRHAGVQYRLGVAYYQRGDFENAKRHLLLGKEEDVCPLRIIEPMYDVIANVAAEFRLPLVDVKAEFESRAEGRIPGRELLVDHVHPSIHGHQLISGWILDEMLEQEWVALPKEWSEESSGVALQNELFQSHLESLPYVYFELGKDRLAGLKRWAEGKVTREREE
ncbi:MAG: lysophospholipase L1-like esterase [Mariniblastus sp.]|jgi:lysophospholipase L1-like esterase